MLRRVAIVLSSLPPSVASELLGSMSNNSKQSVRRAMSGLSDIDPLERRRAFHAFKASMEQQPQQRGRATDRASSSVIPGNASASGSPTYPATYNSPNQSPATPQPTTAASPNAVSGQLLFLEEVGDQDLLDMLAGEHPQTIAVVLASITPEKAGAILPRLDARTQTETLRRIGQLDSSPDEAIADVAELFQQRVNEKMNRASGSHGRSALDAILSAMPDHAHPNMHRSAVENSNSSRRHSDHDTAHPVARTGSQDLSPRHEQAEFPTTDEPQRDLTQRLRVAEHTLPESQNGSDSDRGSATSESTLQASDSVGIRNNTPSLNFNSTDSIAKHLENLTPAALCQALGRVDTRVAMLALCGLPNQVSESALAMLPRAEAKKVRSAMSSLHSLNLRDIDDAKEAIARVSVAGASAAGNTSKSNHNAPVAA